ncbi:MAG: hypothetical protein ACRD0R_05665 [Acidimicrobiales bacterium]
MHNVIRSSARGLVAATLGLSVAVAHLGGLLPLGWPGGAAPAAAKPVPAGSPGVTRYFGAGAYRGIRAAVAATPRVCDLSDDALTALVLAPIFKEVSMAETPDAAPSPMTLSRWDEWTGVKSGSNNMDANYGLYAFRDPHATPYRRAYWTPGIGIFQYDVAGVGAPYTAAEMMNVELIARDVAAGMAKRYCAATGDGYAKRAAAWRPGRASAAWPRARPCCRRWSASAGPPSRPSGSSRASTTPAAWSTAPACSRVRTCRATTSTRPGPRAPTGGPPTIPAGERSPRAKLR